MNNATNTLTNRLIVPPTGLRIVGGTTSTDFNSSISAFWNPSQASISYASGWNALTNTSYASGSAGGGGLAPWLPQNPNGLTWDNNGRVTINVTGKYCVSLWVGNVYGLTSGNPSNTCQIAIVIVSSTTSTAYNQTASVSNTLPSENNVIASGCTNYTGELQATAVVPLTAGTVLQTNLYNGLSSAKSNTFNIQFSVQLMQAYN